VTAPEPKYLKPSEVAALFKVDSKTVSRWARDGKLPFIRTIGGHRRYPENEVRELVKLEHGQQ
jgi:excisionase family DNA binding protein